MTDKTGLFRASAMRVPSAEELQGIADDLGLKCSLEEIQVTQDQFKDTANILTRLMDLKAPTLPVKYPRTPGYKPSPEENRNNAWYWRCDIQGAPEGKLKGKTIGVKDNICVAGVPLTNGSAVLAGFTPNVDATVITRILDAGGRILGKTNCEDLCFSGSSCTCVEGPVTNPHDPTRSAGGSSSGSGVAVLNGDVDMALGGDQGGSIRIPASWCGIVGLKPTHGLVPYTGIMPIEITLDHTGPMARNVRDCALLLEVIAGYDAGRDPRQRPDIVIPPYSTMLDDGVAGKKVALLKEGFDLCLEEDVKSIVREAALSLPKAGVVVEEVSLPEHRDGHAIWSGVAFQGAYNCMIKENGNGCHWKGYYDPGLQEAARRGYATRQSDMSTNLKASCLVGEYLNRSYGNLFYGRAQNLVLSLTEAYNRVLEKYDAIIMPTLPFKASKLPTKETSLADRYAHCFAMVTNTCPFDSTGNPALSINAGNSQGLPVGMMLVGRHYDELTLLQLGHAFEKIRTM